MKIGFIGLGIMGSRMAKNLAREGYTLYVNNRSKSKAEELIKEDHVTWKDTPAEVAEEVDILFTVLSSPEVVLNLATGDKGFLYYLRKDAIWVDSSTVNPSFSRDMAAFSKERDIKFLDAPVAGSKDPAEKGKLLFLVGGEKATVDVCAPLFQVMGKKYIHAGENGKGSSLKMVFNLLLGQAMYAFSEGMNLGQSLGLDQNLLLDVLLQSPVVAPFIALKREKMEKGNYEAEFPLQWMQKDLQLASQTAYEQELALPAVNVIKEMYALAKQEGYSEKDFSAIYEFLDKKRDKE